MTGNVSRTYLGFNICCTRMVPTQCKVKVFFGFFSLIYYLRFEH